MLKGINLAIEDMGPRDLRAYDIYEGEQITLEFEGNIKVSGEIITGTRNLQGEILLIKFKNCTVTHGETVLFAPEWGIYDMAVGKKITSAFSGPADVSSFDMITHVPTSHTIKQKKSSKREELENLYLNIRNLREGKPAEIKLKEAFGAVTTNHENDWLLSVEIAELAKKENHSDLIEKVLNQLEKVKTKRPEIANLIDGGLALIFEKQTT
jgi:phenylalanine-4-hydroxylase